MKFRYFQPCEDKVRNRLIIIAASVVLAGCVSTASRVSTDYYNVGGTTASQIDRNIRANGPMKGHALAVAAISFEPVAVNQQVSADSCKFTAARFRVNANITLPRWIDKSKSDDRVLKRSLANLSRYAELHEKTHVRIAEKFAQQLGRNILALKPRSTCERLDKDAERVFKAMLKDHNKAQNAFDALEQKRIAALIAANS